MAQIISYRTPDNAPVYRCSLCGDLLVLVAGNYGDEENLPAWEKSQVCQGNLGNAHLPY